MFLTKINKEPNLTPKWSKNTYDNFKPIALRSDNPILFLPQMTFREQTRLTG